MTIFITISRGSIARNILQNEFYDLVKRHFSKVVIISPAAGDERFEAEFGAPNVEIIPAPAERESFWDGLAVRLNRYLIFTRSTVSRGLYWYIDIPTRAGWLIKFIKFIFIGAIFYPLSKVSFVRRALRYFDYTFLERETVRTYEDLFERYQPQAVFSTNIMDESALLKAARKRGIPSIAMPKSWDNLSKRYFRARSDAVVVWSAYMKEQMMKLQDYRDTEVEVIGIPQFDYYTDSSRHESREDFCRRVGLDPEKKIICFGSEGKVMLSDTDIAQILYDLVCQGKLDTECQLFIRPHFGYKHDEKKFYKLCDKPGVVIDTFNVPSGGFRDEWDYSVEHMNHFLSIIRHSDILVNTGSTLSLDAAALRTPTVLIMFDGFEKKPFYASSKRWYMCDYYEELLHYTPGLIADNIESLRESINQLFQDPEFLSQNQKQICDRFCYRVDGNSGKRLFQKIRQYAAIQ